MKTDNTFSLMSQIKQLSVSLIEKELKKNNIKGISSSHGSIIHTLEKNDGISMTEISNLIKRDRSTVTTLVSKLEKNGYISLRKNEADSRSNLVYLTKKGKEIYPDFNKISENLFIISKNNINEKEWKVFREVLKKLHKNLENNK